MKQELYDQKMSNLKTALSRQEGAYVPTLAYPGGGTAAWAGKRMVDIFYDPDEYAAAMNAVFGEMWIDCTIFSGTQTTPGIAEAFHGNVQMKFSPDGTTEEHYQMSQMREDEYDQLLDDPDRYVKEALVPRKYKEMLSGDPSDMVNAVKKLFQEQRYNGMELFGRVNNGMVEDYGIVHLVDFSFELNPGYPSLDLLFDSFRGFKGTLADLRRRPKDVKAAIDKLWEVRMQPWFEMDIPFDFPYFASYPHIPTYLSPKQFGELYWPQYKMIIDKLAEKGNKMLICCEGKWEHLFPFFREVPKDSCILMLDDDDLFESYKAIGDWQIIAGGAKLSKIRMESKENNLDYAKRAIDECAPGGSFIFGTDRCWISPGDVNQNMIDVFNFAHEYSKK